MAEPEGVGVGGGRSGAVDVEMEGDAVMEPVSRGSRDEPVSVEAEEEGTRGEELEALLVQLAKQEKRLLKGIKKGAPLQELDDRRHTVQKSYVHLIFRDIGFALRNGLVQGLWKSCCHKPIERFRKQLHEADSAPESARGKTLEAVRQAFREFCVGARELLQHVLTRLHKLLKGADSATTSHVHELCFLCLLYLGDLARYEKAHAPDGSTKPDWTVATHHYSQANLLQPRSGATHNQLAVLAMHNNAELLFIYRSCRALLVPDSFQLAETNLTIQYDRNAKMVAAMRKSPIVERIESAGPQALFRNPSLRRPTLQWLLVRFVRVSALLASGEELASIPPLVRAIGGDTGRLLRCDSLGALELLQMLVIAIYGVHRTEDFPEGHIHTAEDDRRRNIVRVYALIALFSLVANLCKHLRARVAAKSSLEQLTSETITSALAPIGVMCDWMRVRTHFWRDSIVLPHTSDDERGASVDETPTRRLGVPSALRLSDAELEEAGHLVEVLRRQLVDALLNLGNSLVKIRAIVEGSPTTSERHTLPEEVELRGFQPLRGMYDHLPLSEATKAGMDRALATGLPAATVFVDNSATDADIIKHRSAKVLAVLHCACTDSDFDIEPDTVRGAGFYRKVPTPSADEGSASKQESPTPSETSGSQGGFGGAAAVVSSFPDPLPAAFVGTSHADGDAARSPAREPATRGAPATRSAPAAPAVSFAVPTFGGDGFDVDRAAFGADGGVAASSSMPGSLFSSTRVGLPSRLPPGLDVPPRTGGGDTPTRVSDTWMSNTGELVRAGRTGTAAADASWNRGASDLGGVSLFPSFNTAPNPWSNVDGPMPPAATEPSATEHGRSGIGLLRPASDLRWLGTGDSAATFAFGSSAFGSAPRDATAPDPARWDDGEAPSWDSEGATPWSRNPFASRT